MAHIVFDGVNLQRERARQMAKPARRYEWLAALVVLALGAVVVLL